MPTKPRVLIVDDEKDVRLIVKASLEPDYETVEAQDGLDALEKLSRVEPDMIILDVMMPLMDGFEACSSIRKNTAYTRVPVMFLSALTEREQIKKGYGCGGDLYLTKPFEPDRLKRNIDSFFQQHGSHIKTKTHTIEELNIIEKNPPAPPLPKVGFDMKPNQAVQSTDAPIKQAVTSPKTKMRPRVMVVDDDENIFDYILLTLRDKYEVVWARDGFQAIEKIVAYEPDLILLDIMIPKVSGYQLCNSIRKNRAFSGVPIIMVSAKGEKKDIDYAYRMGANAYVVKPFEPQELLDVLDNFTSLPTFILKNKKISFTAILTLEEKELSKFAGDDDKYVKKIDQSAKPKESKE